MNDAVDSILKLKAKYQNNWRDRSDWYWLWRLLQEVIELMFALIGLHEGPVDREIAQISSIAINWLELRRERK